MGYKKPIGYEKKKKENNTEMVAEKVSEFLFSFSVNGAWAFERIAFYHL